MFKSEEMLSPEERDYADATHWAQTNNPTDGDRHSASSDYVWQGGGLRYEGEGARTDDGRIEPVPVWLPGRGGTEQGRAR